MRATDGAIEGVTLSDHVELQVIGGDIPPKGICGSGLVDTVAQLRLVGLLDAGGKMRSREEAPEHPLSDRLITIDGVRAFLLAENVYLSQRDVRELQFGKGSIATGIKVLMDVMGVTVADLDEVLLGGSFGSYLNPESAKIIGLVPPVDVDRILSVGEHRRRGRQDVAPLLPRAADCLRATRQDRVRRALRTIGLQRFVRVGAAVSGAGDTAVKNLALLICGALGKEVKTMVDEHGWDVDIYGVPAMHHFYPKKIVDAVDRKLGQLSTGYHRVRGCLRRLRDGRCARAGPRTLRGAAVCADPTATRCSPAAISVGLRTSARQRSS